jgi:hypothetical protein
VRYARLVLLALSLPAGAVGYAVGTQVVAALQVPGGSAGLLGLFVPLFVGGLFMLPFIAPFFDQMAKRDLAEHRARQEADRDERTGPGTGG